MGERLALTPRPPDLRHRLHAHGQGSRQSDRRPPGTRLLELGGNNGIVVMDDADLDLALRAVSSRRWAPRASAAPRPGACSSSAVCSELKRKLANPTARSRWAIRWSRARSWVRWSSSPRVDNRMKRWSGVKAEGAQDPLRRQQDRPSLFYVEPPWSKPRSTCLTCEETFARSSTSSVRRPGAGDPAPQRLPQGLSSASSRSTCAPPSASCPRPEATAASPT